MMSRRFPHKWPFVRGIYHSPVDAPENASNGKHWFFICLSVHKLLNIKSSCQRFGMHDAYVTSLQWPLNSWPSHYSIPRDNGLSWHQRNPLNTWRNNNVVITSKRRHFDVITSKWRRCDVITTSLSRDVSAGKAHSECVTKNCTGVIMLPGVTNWKLIRNSGFATLRRI